MLNFLSSTQSSSSAMGDSELPPTLVLLLLWLWAAAGMRATGAEVGGGDPTGLAAAGSASASVAGSSSVPRSRSSMDVRYPSLSGSNLTCNAAEGRARSGPKLANRSPQPQQ